jgi:hypothetical protein
MIEKEIVNLFILYWRKFKFETSCWVSNIYKLFDKNKDKKYTIIGLYNK